MRRLAALLIGVGLLLVGVMGPARAAVIVRPGTRYSAVSAGSFGLAPVTIVAAGYTPGSHVYVEQCDGTSPSDPQWSPTVDCDLGTSPAAASADGQGRVVFDARDRNHAFRPFEGTSPEGLFNCLGPHQASPHNGLLDSRGCTVRVSTTNAAATGDQVFFALALPDPQTAAPQGPPPTTGAPVATAGSVTATQPASGSTANAPTATHGAPSSAHSGPSSLAFTGGFTAMMIVVGLESIAVGLVLMGRRRSRVRELQR